MYTSSELFDLVEHLTLSLQALWSDRASYDSPEFETACDSAVQYECREFIAHRFPSLPARKRAALYHRLVRSVQDEMGVM